MVVLDIQASNKQQPSGYVYYRKLDKHYNEIPFGGIGVGWIIEKDYIKFAFSICNDKDRFIKKVSRKIILRRLFGELEKNDNKYIITLDKKYISDLLNEHIVPKYLLKNIEVDLENISNKFIRRIIESFMKESKTLCEYC